MKKRTLITIETDRVLMIDGGRRRSSSRAAWCAACGSQARMLTVDEAAAVAQTTSRTIYQWVEARKLHFTETADGRLFICLNSLS
jgi:excisionase family DNA binding protein